MCALPGRQARPQPVRRALWTLLAVLGVACNAPSSPTLPAGPYLLRVQPSASCRHEDGNGLPLNTMQFPVRAEPRAGGATLVPVSAECEATLRLDLLVSPSRVEGSLSGGALAEGPNPGCFGYGISFSESGPGSGAASIKGVRRTGTRGFEVPEGLLNGEINIGLRYSAAGGRCRADDHRWSLSPL